MHAEKNITSIKDEAVIEARSLQTSKGRLASQKFLVEGEEQILWVMDSPCQLFRVFIHEKQKNHQLVERLKAAKVPLCFATDGILKKITDTSYLVPFIGIAHYPNQHSILKDEFIVVLDGLNDFGNIGTIVRTSAAFGIRDFISTSEEFDLFYRKTIDASRGTVFSSRLKRFRSGIEAVQSLKQQGYQVAVTTPHASVMQSFATIEQKPIAIILGNETTGISQEVMDNADIKIQIPMSRSVESLNVGVAAGISLYEMKIKWILTMLTKKIQDSMGRLLSCAARWSRLVFDKKLREVSPFNADQAILMMILKCDGISTTQKLAHDAGISSSTDIQSQINPLIKQGMIIQKENTLSLSEKGEEMIAKIWSVHELSEQIVFNGISEQEKEVFIKAIEKIYQNCEEIVPFS